jgi:hypothetical protein
MYIPHKFFFSIKSKRNVDENIYLLLGFKYKSRIKKV